MIAEKNMKNSKPNTLKNGKSKCKYGCDGSGVIITNNNSATICKCVQENYEKSKAEKILKFADIPVHFRDLTIDSFRTDVYSKQIDKKKAEVAKLAVSNYMKHFKLYLQSGLGLYFYSEVPGSGKSRMAMSLANDLIKEHKEQVKYITVSDLFSNIKSTFDGNSTNTSDELIEAVRSTNVLILDEVGVERVTDWVEEVFFSIINDRVNNNKVTIFTSNKRISELSYTERTKSRIERSTELLLFPEEDVRNKLGDMKKQDLRKLLLSK